VCEPIASDRRTPQLPQQQANPSPTHLQGAVRGEVSVRVAEVWLKAVAVQERLHRKLQRRVVEHHHVRRQRRFGCGCVAPERREQ